MGKEGRQEKDPVFFELKNRTPFAFAGIWDTWKDAEGKEFDTCAIVTTVANSVVAPIHPRMPVVLAQKDENIWLERATPLIQIKELLKPYPPHNMTSSMSLSETAFFRHGHGS